ncbi:carbon monoxide dehydrogenase subunit G [Pelomonas saccharophila]|uniref:Carbon monoxide dehydrogenase subunit G n=1 Tax=Roseateles saccharophilus TaxID=304 RepID=A0ABU1YQH4_ROSSA|nr:carbon monoxide dehydrogenase subunit G [Roseateles saccharophilus]MDR7271112.1 carbon monoxide dehydrogenase subunit G [Roseateles saccharophilus]
MQITGQQTLPVSQVQAWAALNDTTMLQAAVPGCEAITPAGDNAFDVLMAVSIGPVKAKFKGRLQLSELTPPQSYRLGFEGSGGAAGHGKGQALVQLQAVAAQETVLSYDVTASVGGKLAQIGSRLVDAAAQKLAEDFFARFRAALIERHPPAQAETAPPEAPPGLLRRLSAWLRRLFG